MLRVFLACLAVATFGIASASADEPAPPASEPEAPAKPPAKKEDAPAKDVPNEDVPEKDAPKEGTVEAWARSDANPVGGWYGLRKGYRGRFANYVAPTMELLGLVELEHNARNNRVRAA